MSEHTPLTEAERDEILRAGFSTHDHLLQRDPTLAAVERIIAARTSTATADTEALADWLGDMPESRNVFDITDEATTVINIDVETLAQRIAAHYAAAVRALLDAAADTTATDAAASSGPLPEAVRRRVLNQRLGEHRERLRQHMSEQSVTIENESYGDGFANGLSQAIEWFCETLFNPATETYREPEPTTWGPALTALADQIADATRRAIDTGYGTDDRHGLLANAVADEVVHGKRFPIRLAAQFGRASTDDEHCRRCGGDNFVWAAASPLWNYVMRGNDINGEPIFGDLVCMRCFVVLAMMAGIKGRWRLTVNPEPEGLVYETPSGRRWDPERFLWVEDEPTEDVHSGTDRGGGLDCPARERPGP